MSRANPERIDPIRNDVFAKKQQNFETQEPGASRRGVTPCAT